jgi:outer membrane receptor protein involved in Fe transport
LGGNKVYSAGSAIPASGPPIRVNLSARYDFILDNLPLYFVGDVGYQSKTRRSGTSAFGAYNFDANLRADEAYTQTNVRLGLQFDKIDLSVFVTNLTDEAPLLGYTHTSSTNPVYTAYTLQPRTAGLTLSYRY